MSKSYSEKLLDPRWQKKRLEIFKRDKWKCAMCSDTSNTLQVHHTAYNGEPWEAPNDNLVTVCKHCHFHITELNFKSLKDVTDYKKIIYNEGHILIIHNLNGKTACYLYFDNLLLSSFSFNANSPALEYMRKINKKL